MRRQVAYPTPSFAAHPDSFTKRASSRVLLCLAATLVVALAAHIVFPLPFSPVPFTLQPLAVLGVGLALGPFAGAAALLAYLAEGAVGFPVFSPTGLGGIAQLLGPTGGYLLAYPLVAFTCGLLSQQFSKRFSRFSAAVLACSLATVLLFAFGCSWLAFQMHLNFKTALLAGVVPFLPGEAVKVLAAAGVYRALKPSAFRS